jgi:hypothetical protein
MKLGLRDRLALYEFMCVSVGKYASCQLLNAWTCLCVYIKHDTWSYLIGILYESLPSDLVPVCVRLDKHVPSATKNYYETAKYDYGFSATRTIEWLHCKLQTRPLVRKGAPYKQGRNFQTAKFRQEAISGRKSQSGFDTKTYWLSQS